MIKVVTLFLSLFILNVIKAQTFTNSAGGSIPDNGAGFTCYPVTVSGVGNINGTSGLKSICLNIVHPRAADLIIRLTAPDGTYIPLASEVGGEDPDFTGTCFKATGSLIGFASAPFTGDHIPQASLGWFNNNINANGTWSLCIRDVNATNVGSLSNFNLTFGTSPVAYPVANCSGNLPLGNFCNSAPVICNANNYCGSTGETYSSYTWPQLSAITCSAGMQIFNNSFLKFVASATSATFNVRAFSSLSMDGISVLAFEGGCGSGAVTAKGCVAQILPSATPTVFTASGLTIGNTYYIMVDGKNGDVNSYTVAALTGVSFTSGAPTFAAIPAFCSGATAPILPTVSTNGVSGTWSPSVVSNTTSGMYTFSPSAGQCSTTPVSINITVTPSTTPTFTPIAAFCSGTVAPTLPSTSNNGFTGTWNPAVVSNTVAATYTFTPNAGQCATTATLTTTITTGATPTFTAIPAFCSGTVAPTLPTTSNNGFVGTWNPATVSNTTGATYTFTPNTGQCATTTTLTTMVTAGATPTFNPIAPFCNGGTAPILQTTSNNSFVGTWSPATVSNTASGTYTFTPNAGQCATVTNINITVNSPLAAPTITASGPLAICYPLGSVTLTSSAATGNQWYRDGFSISGATGNTLLVNQNIGSYTVKYTSSGCVSSVSNAIAVAITVTPLQPSISATGTNGFSSCVGLTNTLDASTNVGLQWYKDGVVIPGVTSTSYGTTQSGTYTITSTLNGCTSPVSPGFPVTFFPIPSTPSITPAASASFCTGGSVLLSSSASVGNQWYKDGTIISGATATTYSATAAGSYTVKTTANNCGSAISAATLVVVNTIPNAPTVSPSGAVSACTGQTTTLTSSATIGNQWYLNGSIIAGATGTTYGATTNGVYTVTTTNGSCTSTASAGTTITISATPSAPTITANTTTTFCAGGSVTLTSSATANNQWYKDGAIISGATNNTYSANTSGSYTVLISNGTCISPQSTATVVTVNAIPATPTITAGGPVTFCAGGSVTLTSSSATGNQWYNGATLITGATNATYTATATGNYTVINSILGCPSAASVATVVTVNTIPATPTITAGGPLTFCAGGSVTLTSSAATGNQWYNGATLITGATNTTYTATATGNYNTKITTAGCTSNTSLNVAVVSNTLPAVPILTAIGNAFSTTAGFAGYKWFLNNVQISGATTNTYTATAIGVYKVEVTDANGCKNTSADYNHTSTGLNNIVLEGASIKLLQNPVNNLVTINIHNARLNATFQAMLLDASGKIIKTQMVRNGINQINVSNILSGFYILNVVGEKQSKIIKVAIMH
jgi:subtilisin-like proprotein convertase family protein